MQHGARPQRCSVLSCSMAGVVLFARVCSLLGVCLPEQDAITVRLSQHCIQDLIWLPTTQVKAGRFSEDEARYFFQQLISGVEYCHDQARQTMACRPAHAWRCPLHENKQLPPLHAGSTSTHADWACLQVVCRLANMALQPVVLYRTAIMAVAGRVPPRPEAGEHAAGPAIAKNHSNHIVLCVS